MLGYAFIVEFLSLRIYCFVTISFFVFYSVHIRKYSMLSQLY